MTNKTAAMRYARALLDVAINERADLDQIERALFRASARPWPSCWRQAR